MILQKVQSLTRPMVTPANFHHINSSNSGDRYGSQVKCQSIAVSGRARFLAGMIAAARHSGAQAVAGPALRAYLAPGRQVAVAGQRARCTAEKYSNTTASSDRT